MVVSYQDDRQDRQLLDVTVVYQSPHMGILRSYQRDRDITKNRKKRKYISRAIEEHQKQFLQG